MKGVITTNHPFLLYPILYLTAIIVVVIYFYSPDFQRPNVRDVRVNRNIGILAVTRSDVISAVYVCLRQSNGKHAKISLSKIETVAFT